jgi:hypothetical protein
MCDQEETITRQLLDPRFHYPHKKVHALFLCWEDDNTEVWLDIERLKNVLESGYQATVAHQIPTNDSWKSVRSQVEDLAPHAPAEQ